MSKQTPEEFVADAIQTSPNMVTRVRTSAKDPATWIIAGATATVAAIGTFFLGHKFGDKVLGGKTVVSPLED
ncbi:MAG TPA: hypothetical protein PKN48_00990 [Bacteroidales bacterium]|nr:hypothetical protein [Bacteroidales bacterium]